jgi:hypothetical protein
MKRVVVHIDCLVLKGFRHEDRHAIAAGLQQELARAFADHNAVAFLKNAADLTRLRVSGVQIEHGTKPQRVGEHVGRGIAKELKR